MQFGYETKISRLLAAQIALARVHGVETCLELDGDRQLAIGTEDWPDDLITIKCPHIARMESNREHMKYLDQMVARIALGLS